MRIAIAGFQHETNTFATTKTGFRDFVMEDSWPGLLTGSDVLTGTAGLNLPLAGFIAEAAQLSDVELLPLFWCAAEPGGEVADAAFDRICGMLLDGLRGAMPLDGLYLDLHGAMVTATHEDGEGELLRRVRAEIGEAVPIVASLDLHANLTEAMVRHSSALAIFRSYPHLDMASTGGRCLPVLRRLVAGGRIFRSYRQCPYLIPLHAQYTGMEPARSLYADLDKSADAWGEIAMGFPAADIRDAGAAVVAHAASQAQADDFAEDLLGRLLRAEQMFETHLFSPSEAVRIAMENTSGRPVILADVQDNPGAGASSDATELVKALLEQGAEGVLVGLMHDPEMAALAYDRGVGAEIEGALGGRSGVAGSSPLTGRFRVERLSDGHCAYTGEMYGGGIATLGKSAVLRVVSDRADIRIVTVSIRNQALDLAHFTHFGLDPRAARIVCVKSTVHFRADFEPIAAQVLNVVAPGTNPCVLRDTPYRRLRPGIRLGPLGPACGLPATHG